MTTALGGPGPEPGYANEVSAGWSALKRAAPDWRRPVGEGLGGEDSWDPASGEQADKRGRERERASEGRVRRVREEDGLHNARLGPAACLFSFLVSVSV